LGKGRGTETRCKTHLKKASTKRKLRKKNNKSRKRDDKEEWGGGVVEFKGRGAYTGGT